MDISIYLVVDPPVNRIATGYDVGDVVNVHPTEKCGAPNLSMPFGFIHITGCTDTDLDALQVALNYPQHEAHERGEKRGVTIDLTGLDMSTKEVTLAYPDFLARWGRVG